MVISLATPIPRAPSGPPVLMLVMEGLRPKDVSSAHSPFLSTFRETAVVAGALRGAPGEQGWGEVFAGAWPEQTGALAMWSLDPAEILPLGRLAAGIQEAKDFLLARVRRYAPARWPRRRPKGRATPRPPFVPSVLRHSLRAVDDPNRYLRPGGAQVPSLIDSLLAAGCRVEMTAFPGSPWEEKKLISRLGFMSRAFLDRHDLYLARLPGGERLTLRHGPNSPERNQLVRDLDGLVERVVHRFRRQWKEGVVIVASVRGSVAAQTYIDAAGWVGRLAAGYGLRPYRDYAMLVNRTMIRVWTLSSAAQSVLPALAQETNELRRHGWFLTPELAKRHRLPPPGLVAGDCVWFARPGVVVFPNDEDALRPRAATGYLTEPDTAKEGEGHLGATSREERNHGALAEDPRAARDCGLVMISVPDAGKGSSAESGATPRTDCDAWRVDLCTTLARLLSVRVPAAAQGKNLLRSS